MFEYGLFFFYLDILTGNNIKKSFLSKDNYDFPRHKRTVDLDEGENGDGKLCYFQYNIQSIKKKIVIFPMNKITFTAQEKNPKAKLKLQTLSFI